MKKFFGLFAVIIAVAAVAFTTPSAKEIKKDSKRTDYYFRYKSTAPANGEATNTNWEEITQAVYDAPGCPGTRSGCKLLTTSVVVSGSVNVPMSVPTNTNTTGGITTIDPVASGAVIQVKNKTN